MRIGTNPAKGTKVEINDSYHRIIIPVYIPNLEDFFKESLSSFSILEVTLSKLKHNAAKSPFFILNVLFSLDTLFTFG